MCGMKRRPAKFDAKKELKAIARERVGSVKPGRVIVPKTARKKPKHKKPPRTEEI
jgi:hypothetical protein